MTVKLKPHCLHFKLLVCEGLSFKANSIYSLFRFIEILFNSTTLFVISSV